jgi:hypothetical protein
MAWFKSDITTEGAFIETQATAPPAPSGEEPPIYG